MRGQAAVGRTSGDSLKRSPLSALCWANGPPSSGTAPSAYPSPPNGDFKRLLPETCIAAASAPRPCEFLLQSHTRSAINEVQPPLDGKVTAQMPQRGTIRE